MQMKHWPFYFMNWFYHFASKVGPKINVTIWHSTENI